MADVSANRQHGQNQLIHFPHSRVAQIAPINLSIILFLANLYHIHIFGGEWAGPCLEVKPDVEEDEGDGDEKADQLEHLNVRTPDADSPRGPSCGLKFLLLFKMFISSKDILHYWLWCNTVHTLFILLRVKAFHLFLKNKITRS